MQNTQIIENTIKEILDYLNLDLKFSVDYLPLLDDETRITIFDDIKSNINLDEYFTKIRHDLSSSKFANDIRYNLQEELNIARKEMDELKVQIKELQKYKNYYELELNLKHGKK